MQSQIEYRDIIRKAIDRIIAIHGDSDPYYNKVIRALIADLKDYEANIYWLNRPSPFTSLDKYLEYIMNLFWSEWLGQ